MLNKMQTLKERIELIMEMKSWDIATTARTAGVSHSAVSQWLGKGSNHWVSVLCVYRRTSNSEHCTCKPSGCDDH